MGKKNISIALFPTILVILICFIQRNSIFILNSMDLKGLSIISVVLVFPIVFLVQGVLAMVNNTHKILALGVSLISYLIYLFFIMKESTLIYIAFYIVWYVIGILIGSVIKKYSDNFKIR